MDWQEIEAVDPSLACYVQDANETFSIGDSMPLLFGDFMESNILRCWNFLFNQDLIAEYNLENPYVLVDEGRWTLDTLTEMITGTARDLDGDGNMELGDFFGFAADSLATLDAFSRSCEMNAISKDENNLPVISYWGEHIPEAFEKIYRLYYETADAYIAATSLAHIDDVFAENKAIFAASRIDLLMNDKIREMESIHGVLPYPKRSENQEGYGTYLSGTFSAQMIGIDQPASSFERTGTITHALNVLSHEYVIPAIYDITLKTRDARDPESSRMMDLILSSRTYSFDSCDEATFPLSPYKTVRTLIGKKQNTNIASYYEANLESAQTWLDDMIAAYNQVD